jgi:hypothetical protein
LESKIERGIDGCAGQPELRNLHATTRRCRDSTNQHRFGGRGEDHECGPSGRADDGSADVEVVHFYGFDVIPTEVDVLGDRAGAADANDGGSRPTCEVSARDTEANSTARRETNACALVIAQDDLATVQRLLQSVDASRRDFVVRETRRANHDRKDADREPM